MFAVFRINKKRILPAVAMSVVFILTIALFGMPDTTVQAQPITVAIDAGHGGYDGGVTGLTRHIRESDVNLSIAQYLQAYLKNNGYKTVMTRAEDRAPVEAGSIKRQDMDMRLTTIANANADVAVSIHCNFYPSRYRRGIQVFYNKQADMPLAQALQDHLNGTQNLPTIGRKFEPLWGDYYLLAKASCPAAIVECGFLSNAEDEALLADENYRMTLAFQIFVAIDSIYSTAEQSTLAY